MTFATDLQNASLGRTRALPRGQLISYACCVSATALQLPRQASPERVGEYSQTRLSYRGVWKAVKRFERLLLLGSHTSTSFPAKPTPKRRHREAKTAPSQLTIST